MKKRNVKNDGKTIDLIFLILFAGSALYWLVISKHPLIKTRLMAALSFKSSIGWRAFIRRRLSDAYP